LTPKLRSLLRARCTSARRPTSSGQSSRCARLSSMVSGFPRCWCSRTCPTGAANRRSVHVPSGSVGSSLPGLGEQGTARPSRPYRWTEFCNPTPTRPTQTCPKSAASSARDYFRVAPHPPIEALKAIAEHYPVFKVRRARRHSGHARRGLTSHLSGS
jgi:hypothetical protein